MGSSTSPPHEAQTGTRKLVNIPWGFQKDFFGCSRPPASAQAASCGSRGWAGVRTGGPPRDLLLKVVVEE